MAASPGAPEASPPPSPLVEAGTPPLAEEPIQNRCRLCAKETTDWIDIFGELGKQQGLPERVRLCLPVLISEDDELSNAICSECQTALEGVRSFFEGCFNANQELIIQYRKTKGSHLDLNTHINQFVRTFSSSTPSVPSIKVEPSNYLDVDLGVNNDEHQGDTNHEGYYEDGQEQENVINDNNEENEAIFKIPSLPPEHAGNGIKKKKFKSKDGRKLRKKRRKTDSLEDIEKSYRRKYNPDGSPFDPFFDNPEDALDHRPKKIGKGQKSNRGRKKIVPLALKTCSECGECFPDHMGNLAHWKEKHPDKEVVYKCTEVNREENTPCKFESKEPEEVFKHRLRHKARIKGEIKMEGKEKNVDFSKLTFSCKLCGKEYTASYLINRHMLAHADRKDNPCGLCGNTFKTAVELKAHIRVHEEDDVKYTHCCELCGKRFTQRANLDAHLRVHSGYKPHTCDYCGKAFSQKGNMEEHRRVHTGEKPFVCELCGAAYARRSEMVLHTRIAHTGERPFQCAFCPKNFQRRDLMRKHERIHTDTRPYACQYCAKAFTQRDKMVVHTRLHTGERPYVCDVCGKGFCESGNLKKHMRVHGKEPPSIMHQNNKGKPAPNPSGQYSGKHHIKHENANFLQQQQAATLAAAAVQQSQNTPQQASTPQQTQPQTSSQQQTPVVNPQAQHQQNSQQQQQHHPPSQQVAQQQVNSHHSVQQQQQSSHNNSDYQQQLQPEHDNTNVTAAAAAAAAASAAAASVASNLRNDSPHSPAPLPSVASAAMAVAAALRQPQVHQSMHSSPNLPAQVKLEQQPQYSFTMAAAAAARAAAMNQGNHVMGGGVHISGRSGTPLHDIDNQSDAGSERSVTSPFVPGATNQHPAHVHHQTQPSTLPYHMQHPLIQHLMDSQHTRDFRDVWSGYQHHAAHQSGQHGEGGANAH